MAFKRLTFKYNPLAKPKRVILFPVLCFLLLSGQLSFAQKTPANENQLKKQANSYFDDGNYAQAFDQYSQLLSLHPQDANYNYRFGACMLFSQADKKKPIDYIETAIKQPDVENLAYYFLGRAYHLNYRFDDAIKAYQHFKDKASSGDLKKYPVDRLMQMCLNGKQLLGNLHDLDVLRKKELAISDYYEAYDLSLNGGNLLVEPDDFKTKTDKKKNLTSIIYLSPDRSKLFFSSYGDDDKNGKDIYVAYKLPNGAWGKPANLGNVINTPYDEDYPFYDEPTHTLYFSSMGHNSMGGYDIFKSVYDESTKTWSAPVNMDFPINTPGDDILFMADTLGQTAFFSSNRSSPEGRIAVYKIVIQPHPPEQLIVKGTSYNDAGTAFAASRITVKNAQTNEVIGEFNTTADNGSYVMNLANGGHFSYTVETPNHKTQTESVVLPMQNDITPLQQQITYESGSDRLIIKNLNQGAVSDSNYLLAMDVIQQKAAMDVNIDTTKPLKIYTPPVATNTTQPIKPDTGATVSGTEPPDTNSDVAIDTTGKGGVSNNELLQIANSDAKQKQDEAQNDKADANKAVEYAVDKLTESQTLNKQADETAARANNITDPKQKSDTLAKADALRQQAQDANKKSMEGFQYASQLSIQASVKQKEADQATQYTTRLDSALKSRNKEVAIKKLQAQRDSLQKQDELNAPITPSAGDLVRMQAQNVKQDSVEMVKHNEDLKKEADRLQSESEDYVAQAQKTDNPNEKVALLEQARDLANSKKEKENEIAENQKSLVDMHNEYNNLISQAGHVDSVSKNNPAELQVAGGDKTALQTDIKNHVPTPTQTNPTTEGGNTTQPTNTTTAATNPVNPTQTTTNPTTEGGNTTQPTNTTTAATNPTQTNPTQTTTNPTTEGGNTTQPTNTTTAATNPVTNPTQTTTNPTTEGGNTTQPTNTTTAGTNPVTNPTQTTTNPTTEGGNTTQPTNTTTAGTNPVTNPTQTTTNPTTEGGNTTQPTNTTTAATNPVTNPTQTTTNPTTEGGNTTQPTNTTTAGTNPVTNPTQTTTNPTTEGGNTTQPTNTTTAATNPVTNPTQTTTNPTTEGGNTTQPTNPTQSNPTNFAVTPATYTNTQASTADKNSIEFNKQSNLLTNEANDARDQARQATDPAQAKALFHKADSLDEAASEDKLVSTIYKNDADGGQYLSNQEQLNAWQGAMKESTSPNATFAQLKLVDANAYYDQAVKERHKADSTTNAGDKQLHLDNSRQYLETALQKQQEAHDMYLQANPALANVTPQNAATASISQPGTTNPTQTTTNPTTEGGNTTQPTNTTTAATNPTTNPTQTTTNPTTEGGNTTQPTNTTTAATNPTQTNPTQTTTNPTTEGGNTTQPTNTTTAATNPTQTNPTQTTTNPTTEGGNTTQPTNTTTAATNPTQTNPTQTTTNPTTEGGNTTQPTNTTTTAATNPATNPTQTTTNPTIEGGATNPTPGTTTLAVADIVEAPRSPYSAAHPIPMNPQLPEGVIYKVQIGAFSKPIPQNAFRGLSPLAGEKTGTGLTRYTAGLFTDFAKAKDAQGKVKALGYKDAFIVAFYNGKRVPIRDAAAVQNGSQPNPTASNPVNATQPTNTTPPIQTDNNTPVQSTPVTDVKGIFYTVQVGAYKTAVSSSKLFNLSPLFSYNAPNGYIRYNCGIYSSVPKAASAKDAIVSRTPIKDAFVVAYYNGERIEITKAATMLSNGSAVLSQNPHLDLVPAGTQGTQSAPTQNNTSTPPVNNNPAPAVTNTSPANNTVPANAVTLEDTTSGKIVFCVQIGAYSGQIPIDVANNLLKIASQGIHSYKEDDGVTTYTVGHYDNYASAGLLKEELVQDGFPGCFVVAYRNGKKISLKEAQAANNR